MCRRGAATLSTVLNAIFWGVGGISETSGDVPTGVGSTFNRSGRGFRGGGNISETSGDMPTGVGSIPETSDEVSRGGKPLTK